MYKLRIYISWMNKNMILLPTFMYVDELLSASAQNLVG